MEKLNPFQANVPYPLKYQTTRGFMTFLGYRKGALAWNGLGTLHIQYSNKFKNYKPYMNCTGSYTTYECPQSK